MVDTTAKLVRTAADWIGEHTRQLPEDQQRLVTEYIAGDHKEVVMTIQLSRGVVTLVLVDHDRHRELLRVQTPLAIADAPPNSFVH